MPGLFNLINYSHWIYFLLDVPMSSGVLNIRSKGNLLNCYEFEWDPNKGSEVYIIVSKNFDSIFLLQLFICLILYITKFLIVIGSLYAYLTHNWYGITWVFHYRTLVQCTQWHLLCRCNWIQRWCTHHLPVNVLWWLPFQFFPQLWELMENNNCLFHSFK